MVRQIESVTPIPGMDGVFHITYRNDLALRLQESPMPFDELTALLTREYYDQNGIGPDFSTPPEFFPQTGNCYARLAIHAYEQLGRPEKFVVYEAGGGNGTLMRGFLEEAATHREFFAALEYHMIEQSEGLMGRQRDALSEHPGSKVTWHNQDVTKFEFPETDAGMYIAMENDDDLPSKGSVKQNGNPFEVHLTMTNGKPEEVTLDATDKLSAFVAQYPGWWDMVPEGLRVCLPVHIESVYLRERFVASVKRGIMITTDYGYRMEESARYMPNWVFPLYKAFQGNRKLGAIRDAFESVLTRVGNTNYTANVDFSLLGIPGERAGYTSLYLDHHHLLDLFGMREYAELIFQQLASGGQTDELKRYARKLAHVIDIGISDWNTLIQWKGFNLVAEDKQDDLVQWFYALSEKNNLGDVRPEDRKGPAR